MLENLNVVITRPMDQSISLKNKVQALGGVPHVLSTLEIIPLPQDKRMLKIFSDINHYDMLIFTSRNAVNQAAPYFTEKVKTRIAAIGPGTADALIKYSLPVHLMPIAEYNSENLMALPYFQSIQGKRILLVSGKGGRTYLEEELSKRQAIVEKIAVYRRELPDVSLDRISAITTLTNVIIISTSCESFQNLITLMRGFKKQNWLYATPILIISQRMRHYALTQELQANLMILAKNGTDEAILERLIKWYSNRF